MTRSRSSHQQKALKDRQRYFKTTLGRSPAPTIDDNLFEVDATDVEAPETTTETDYQRVRYTQSRPSSIGQILKDRWVEILLTAVIAGLITVLGFLYNQLFTLNREVGEMKSQLDDARRREERLENQLDRLNEKLEAPRQTDKKQ